MPAVLQHPAARLAGRAVEDGVLLVVDLAQRVAAARARLAEAAVDEVDVLVALAGDPQLERARQVLLDRRREALDLVVVEIAGERERRQLRAMEDLVGVRAPDPGERPLVAQQRVQPAVVAGEDLAQLLRRRARAPPARGGRARPRSARATRARPRRASSGRPRSGRARRRPRSGAGTPASSGPSAPGARCRIRPALIRWMRSCSASSAVGKSSHLPRLPAPAKRRPSSSRSGGSNVFSVAMCAGPACSTGEADTSGSSSRTHASTSGSSGMRPTVQRRTRASRAAPPAAVPAAAGTSPPAASASDGSGSSTGSGISRSVRTGESSTGRTASDIPIAPTQIAVRRPNQRAERAADQRAERHHAPDDEAHHRVHPPLQPLGRDRLPEADLGDVVDRDAHARDRLGGDQERDRDSTSARPRAGAARRNRPRRG